MRIEESSVEKSAKGSRPSVQGLNNAPRTPSFAHTQSRILVWGTKLDGVLCVGACLLEGGCASQPWARGSWHFDFLDAREGNLYIIKRIQFCVSLFCKCDSRRQAAARVYKVEDRRAHKSLQ